VFDDGLRFVSRTDQQFDIIISDCTDPIGPGEALFGADFYRACKRCLTPGGVLVTQNGVVFMQADEVRDTAGHLRGLLRTGIFLPLPSPLMSAAA